MNIEYIEAKSMIFKTKSKNWFGTDYNVNIYKGCSHGCIYCDSRSNCYGILDFNRVKVKKDGLFLLEKDLKKKIKTGVIGTGSMSDPYNPLEKELMLTRSFLKLVNKHNFGVAIATKSTLVLRDLDILMEISKHSPVIVKITITAGDNLLCKKIEPNVASTMERFSCLKSLSKMGIYCGVLLMPVLPFINDSVDNIQKIVNLSYENGAKFIYPFFGLTLRDSQRSYFYNKLEYLFPSLKKKYIDSFGMNYACISPNFNYLNNIFKKLCNDFNIQYKMECIIDDYKKGFQCEQLNFF